MELHHIYIYIYMVCNAKAHNTNEAVCVYDDGDCMVCDAKCVIYYIHTLREQMPRRIY